MGAVGSSLNSSVDWVRTQGANTFGGSSDRHGTARERRRRRRQQRRRLRRQQIQREQREARRLGQGDTIPSNAAAGYGVRARDLEEGAGRGYLHHGHESAWTGESMGSDLSSTDCDDSDDDEYDTEDGSGSEGGRDGLVDEDEDNSLFEGGEGKGNGGQNDKHPLYFGPAFHPVTEQTPAQMQLQRQIEQQLEQQQRQEYWQQQYRQQQMLQQQQTQMQSSGGGQPLALQDFILPSAISGMGSHSRGVSEAGLPSPPPMAAGTDNLQDQLYRNSNLYNLISGLNVNPLLTEVQRAGTLDLSVLEQELDDVEGGWFDIDDDEEDEGNEDKDIDFGRDGIVREMVRKICIIFAIDVCNKSDKFANNYMFGPNCSTTATHQAIAHGSGVQRQPEEEHAAPRQECHRHGSKHPCRNNTLAAATTPATDARTPQLPTGLYL